MWSPKSSPSPSGLSLSVALSTEFQGHAFYAPRPGYKGKSACTILRNPHIARNEEILLDPYRPVEQMRKHYLGHLTDVVMVSSTMYAAERLGERTLTGTWSRPSPTPLSTGVWERNYESEKLDNIDNLPFFENPLHPGPRPGRQRLALPVPDGAGHFLLPCGARSPTPPWPGASSPQRELTGRGRQQAGEEVETLAILTGLEIDSAKSGVKPDLSPYLGKPRKQKNLFLTYKYRMEGQGRKKKKGPGPPPNRPGTSSAPPIGSR